MASRSLYNQPRQKQPLLWGEAGGRIKKSVDNMRNYQPEFRATLESGDLILVTDYSGNVEFYMVDPRTKPFYVPPRKKNLATKWSTPLPALQGNVNPGRNPIDLIEANVGLGELGIWKVYAISTGFQFDIEQPANSPVFTSGTQPVRMSYGNTGYHALRGDWARVPEVSTFEDKTTVTLNVTSSNMNEASFNCYVQFEGFRYRLIKTEVPNPADEPRVIQTIQLSALI
jgi:hypothetical protein